MISNVGAILGGIVFGLFSDRIGRRREHRRGARAGDAGDPALGLRADDRGCSSPARS